MDILTKKLMIKQNIEGKKAMPAYMFNSSAKETDVFKAGSKAAVSTTVTINSEGFVGSANHMEWQKDVQTLLDKRNAATNPDTLKINAAQFDETDYYNLIQLTMIGLNSRVLRQADIVAFLDNVITNADFTKTVEFQDFLPFGAIFEAHSGTGENVNLIVTQTGDKSSVRMQIKAVGWKDTLLNELFNQGLSYMERVLDAVAEGYTASKNDESASLILSTTYDASQKQAAIASGDTKEENMYLTWFEALKKIAGLKDPLTGDFIDTANLAALINSQNQADIVRAINGVINTNPAAQVNRISLTEQIGTLVPYMQKTIVNGKVSKVYPGVAINKAYLLVPKAYRWSLIKRAITQQVSAGNALTFGTEDKSWYYVNARYEDLFFGSSNAAVKALLNTKFKGTSGAGFGYIIEVTLPTS
jgi:hypothetical protein